MKNPIKEFGIFPSILAVVAIFVGSTAIFNCNEHDLCINVGADCSSAEAECCEGLTCEGGRCCVPTGDTLAASADPAECCSGETDTRPDGTTRFCCATEGEHTESGNCCNDLYWGGTDGTCYGCVEAGEDIPFIGVPCCDAGAILVGDTCTTCPCGWTYPPGGITHETGEGPVCNCLDTTSIPVPEEIPPGDCVDCTRPGETTAEGDCRQILVLTRDYCPPDDPDDVCLLVTVIASSEESLMACAASRARDTGFTSGNIIFRPLRDDEFVMPMHPEAEADICAHICGAP